ncbi:hypothetical protein A2U01_0100560, partial [Trifolium medium]|nr:hypothetical protein [Trifolium medium]
MVLRREDGRCVGAATKIHKGSDDVCMAEVMGFSEALQIVQNFQLKRVIIEMDAALV